MKTIKFDDGVNTNNIGYLKVTSIDDNNIILGSSVRNIDGELITYNRGNKKEYNISLEEICRSEYDWLLNYALNQTQLTVTIRNDITGAEDTLNAIIELSAPKYDNQKDLYSFSVKVKQYD